MNQEAVLDVLTKIALEKISEQKAKWGSIGRKIREFRKGDIVFHNRYGFVEIVSVNQCDVVTIEGTQKDGMPYQKECVVSELELIAPCESRFDWATELPATQIKKKPQLVLLQANKA